MTATPDAAPLPLPVVTIRPEPGLSATLAQGRALGLAIHGFALFESQPVDWTPPDPKPYTALLAGSAALFRLGGPGLEALHTLPVHAVGESTAQAARAAGFAVAGTGEGGLDVLVGQLPPGQYVRLAGEAHVPLHPAPGVEIDTRVVYRMATRAFPPDLVHLLAPPALVLLHSGEAARHFAAECRRNRIDRSAIMLACLAPRIAEMVDTGWASVAVAPQRSDFALLALARQMCQTGLGRGADRGNKR
ncbi:uroporphyrinogen-III synthase [Novosphingobium sp.]|uniref:uroporphyrinogen-III synthase n=1 Tax=Novosphingobium sp. TaxID=1874826 RepID=UPI0025EC232B|nr:uroporphyrinogen-III synthase [Novosphingobium sp.]